MRPKTVWLYELLDTCKACGGRKVMFGPWNKKYEPTQEVWRFFIPKPGEYPFAARSVKSSNPYRPACQWYALTQNGSPGKKAQENIIVPAATLAAAAERKNKKTEM